METSQLHKTQVQILYALRHTMQARYSELMRPTGLESDVFKFHVRKLINSGMIEKQENGTYVLTAKGKEYANNLSETEQTTQKQPKLTLRICLSRINGNGKTEYLFQERKRNPFWGYWDTIGGPIRWGESIQEAATRELSKQTGLRASAFQIKAFYRVRDFAEDSREILEDKLFVILRADSYSGELSNKWHGGTNVWMTLDELLKTEKYFASTPKMIQLLQSGLSYAEDDVTYTPEQY